MPYTELGSFNQFFKVLIDEKRKNKTACVELKMENMN